MSLQLISWIVKLRSDAARIS